MPIRQILGRWQMNKIGERSASEPFRSLFRRLMGLGAVDDALGRALRSAGLHAIKARSSQFRMRGNADDEGNGRPIEACAYFQHATAAGFAGASEEQKSFFIGERAGDHLQQL